MTMTLEQFLIKNDPDILAQFEGYSSGNLPEIGAKVKTLDWGFGGGPGKILTVNEYGYKGQPTGRKSVWGGDYISLKDASGNYLVEMKDWWKKIVLVK